MPTSSEKPTPNALPLEGTHWNEFVATLSPESTCEFSEWLSQDLAALEAKLERFASRSSVKKSLRR